MAKTESHQKVFYFGDNSDSSDDSDNKNGTIPSICLPLFRGYYIYKYIYIYIFIYIVNIINIYSTLLYPSVFIVIIVTIVTAVGGA